MRGTCPLFSDHLKVFLRALLLCWVVPSPVSGQDSTIVVPNIRFESELIQGIVSNEREIRAGLLYDTERGNIVWEKGVDIAYPIASLTKMMVGLLAIEDIRAGKVCLDDRITVTRLYKKRIRRHRYSTYKVEETYSFEDLLKMAMVASHNESTSWIAQHCEGDVARFVERMNRRALELGMTNTAYSNPSGLPASIERLHNRSTPRDQLILALELLKHPSLVEITSIPYFTVHNGKGNIQFRNHNGLVINYGSEVDGLKTGYTRAAGFCLVASATRGGHRLISVVFGCRSPWVRNGLVAGMMNTYFEAIRLGRLGEADADPSAARILLDSVCRGLTTIRPIIDPAPEVGSDDESFAYTYKTIRERQKSSVTVRSGDNLGRIAQRQGVSLQDLRKWNKLHNSIIRPGQKLVVYKTVTRKVPVKLVIDPEETIAESQPEQDTTEGCETSIASSHAEHSTISTDKTENTVYNEVADNTVGSENQKSVSKLNNNRITSKSSDSSANSRKNFIYHTVQPGDTLWNIAQRYQTNMDQIRKLNRIQNSRYLRSGSRIKIPVSNGG